MFCSSLCAPSCGAAAPCPLADTTNEPCVRQCQSSSVVIQPPATVVTFPGPILSSFPQHSVVGSVGASATASGYGSIYGGHGDVEAMVATGAMGTMEAMVSYGGFGGYGSCGGYGGLRGFGGYGGFGGCG
ncbi:Claw keratin, partial [Nestor notabilis]